MALVNGSKGIGTGFSSVCPKFHPRELANLTIQLIDNHPSPNFDLLPFYRYHNRKFTFNPQRNAWEHVPDFKINNEKNTVVLQ
jgi:hypothetical protein